MKKPKVLFPDLTTEATLGFFSPKILIIGVDEVGRGCLAGPVVAGAAILNPDALVALGFKKSGERPKSVDEANPLFQVKDSKMIAEPLREPLSTAVKAFVRDWSIAEASVAEIEKLNILYASHLAMQRAVEKIEKKLGRKADVVLVDGNIVPKNLKDRGHALIKGDQKSLVIACASVVAKVYRDELMAKLDEKYPGYGLKGHKGYPTPFHKAQVIALGATPIHRMSFKGVKPAAPSIDETTLF